MKPIVTIVAPGNMGAAIGRRLVHNGLVVRTVLHCRSAASHERAVQAGLTSADLGEAAAADIVLSILPPGEALALAETMAPRLKPGTVYADCNAVSPETVKRIAAVIAPTGAEFVDAGIIGGPPRDGDTGPRIYASGPAAAKLALLGRHGLDIRVLDAPVGAASALKMCYGGINKGMTGLVAAILLAADRAGAADALHAELAESQAPLLARMGKALPDMYPKAYRWVAEMEEIAAFAGDEEGAAVIFQGMACLYEALAQDAAGTRVKIKMLDEFLELGQK